MTHQFIHHNRIYVFIGPEGAGKSTQARMLSEALHLPLISTGDMLRRFAKDDTGALGEAARKMFAANGYLKADLMLRMMGEQLQDRVYKQGVILDGSLRTYEEAVRFDEIFEQSNLHLPIIVLYINVPQEESIKRLSFGRKRPDDIIQSVETRLSHFHEQLEERLAIITKKYQLIAIDGMNEKEAVHAEIMEKINEK